MISLSKSEARRLSVAQSDREPLTFVLTGAPRTKKNSGRIVRAGKFPRLLPSATFCEWNALVQPQLMLLRSMTHGLPFRGPVNVKALFLRDADRGDACGFYQALADALEEGGVVENDRQVRQWDGTRLLVDRQNPRVIVTVEAI